MSRPLIAQVNLAALRSNLARARERAPGAQLLAVVKANAYGHGLKRILPALGEADGLALIELDAAIGLREKHYARRILLLEGFFEASELIEVSARRIAVVVHHSEQVRMLEAATNLSRPIEVFVKINTGMNRLGFRPGEVHRIVDRLSQAPSVAVMRFFKIGPARWTVISATAKTASKIKSAPIATQVHRRFRCFGELEVETMSAGWFVGSIRT